MGGPKWTPPIEWVICQVGERPTIVELANLPWWWTVLLCEVDSIRSDAERRLAKKQEH